MITKLDDFRRPYSLHGIFYAICAVVISLPMLGCGSEPTRWDDAQKETKGKQASAVAKEAVPGGEFNKVFPKPDEGYGITFKAEKKGFAQALLTKDGKDLASLAITDTISEPKMKEKFESSSGTFGEYPLANVGTKGTAILVGDRFQVQIRSIDASFDEFQREDWFKKFDLDTLAGLQ